MLPLITERFCRVNCAPDCNRGFHIYIHQQVAFCYQIALDKQQKQGNLEESKARRSTLCLDRVC